MASKEIAKRSGLLWSRDMIERFIELLKKHDCLYNNRNKFYYNRHAKEEICKYILQEMRKKKPTLKIDDIRRKLKVLRTQFARENRLLSLSRIHGELYEPKLWCYNKLSFLEKHTTCVTAVNNKGQQNSQDDADINIFSDEENCTYDDIEDNSIHMEVNTKEEVLSDNTDDLNYEEILKANETNSDTINPTPQMESDRINDQQQTGKYDYLGELVVSQIEDIDIAHRADFAWDVQCLVRKYVLKSKMAQKNVPKADENHTETQKDVTFHKGSNITVNVNFL